MRPSRWSWTATWFVLAVLVAGCSGAPEQPSAAAPTAEPPSPSGTGAGPAIPATTAPYAQVTPGVVTTGRDGVQQVLISGYDRFFDPGVFHVHPGKVRVILRNDDPVEPHNLIFPDNGGARTADTLPGHANAVTVVLNTPGLYDFVCSFHELVGMRGQVKVDAR